MKVSRRITTFMIIAASLGFTAYFFMSSFIDSNSPDNPFTSSQDPNSIPTLTNDVDSCISAPSLDCDKEMLQIKDYCHDNKDKGIPVCSDNRVQQYIDSRGLERPIVNTGK